MQAEVLGVAGVCVARAVTGPPLEQEPPGDRPGASGWAW